jgi:hypothetical protein
MHLAAAPDQAIRSLTVSMPGITESHTFIGGSLHFNYIREIELGLLQLVLHLHLALQKVCVCVCVSDLQ